MWWAIWCIPQYTCNQQMFISKAIIWAISWENLFLSYANNKDANQPPHLRSLISAFVVRCLESIISILTISKISRPWLVLVAEQAGLSLTWSQTPKTGFLLTRPICSHIHCCEAWHLRPCWLEPANEIMVLFVLCKLILQTRLRSHPVGLDVWVLVGPFFYFHIPCARTVKALARLRGCAGSPEPLLVTYVISTIISWAGLLIAKFSVLFIGKVFMSYEPRHEKTCLLGFQPGETETGLLSFRK